MKVFTPWIRPDGSAQLLVDEIAEVAPVATWLKVPKYHRHATDRNGVWRHNPFVETNAVIVGELKTPVIREIAEKLGIPVVSL